MSTSGDSPTAIVVGAGIFGASIAHALTQRGWAVQIIECYVPGHVRSSSHDLSRLLRLSHGDEDLPDNWYTRSALRSRELWLEIGLDEGVELFVPSGAMWAARSDAGFESRSEQDLAALQIPTHRLDPAEAAQFFPDVRDDDLAFLLYEPLAGVLRATTCVQTLISRALRSGAVLRTGRARPGPAGPLLDAEQLGADRVIWACGPWLATMFPDLVSLRSVKQ
nr:FAD-dependent oxidoreductase [Actinomycetota bacterium]